MYLHMTLIKLNYNCSADTELNSLLARRVCVEPCCSRECLLSKGFEAGVQLVEQCFAELRGFTRIEKKNFMRAKVRHCLDVDRSKKGYLRPNWTIGSAPGRVQAHVCRKCFCGVYEIGHTFLDSLCKEIKGGIVETCAELNDAVPAMSPDGVKHLNLLASSFNTTLTRAQLAALSVPNTTAALGYSFLMRLVTSSLWLKKFT